MLDSHKYNRHISLKILQNNDVRKLRGEILFQYLYLQLKKLMKNKNHRNPCQLQIHKNLVKKY